MVRVQKFFNKPSRTKQSFKAQCDLGLILKRYRAVYGDSTFEQLQAAVGGEYGDFSDIPDYRTALDHVSRAQESFMKLPALLRAKFNHDPASFLDFAQDPKNLDELRSLGLAKPKPVESAPISA